MPYAIYILIALQVLDIVSTVIALRKPGNYEANPFISKLMQAVGVIPALVLVKGLAAAIIWAAKDQLPVELVWLFCAGYAYVVVNNFRNAK